MRRSRRRRTRKQNKRRKRTVVIIIIIFFFTINLMLHTPTRHTRRNLSVSPTLSLSTPTIHLKVYSSRFFFPSSERSPPPRANATTRRRCGGLLWNQLLLLPRTRRTSSRRRLGWTAPRLAWCRISSSLRSAFPQGSPIDTRSICLIQQVLMETQMMSHEEEGRGRARLT